MKQSHGMKKAVAGIMTFVFGFLCLFVAPAQAAMMGTGDLLRLPGSDTAPSAEILNDTRQALAHQLQEWGVSPQEARARVAAMTDSEVIRLAEAIEQMPAGAGVLEFLAVLALLGFITLVITDIVGVTDVFTFIKKM
ncbi:PA2779 family protein [Desulfatitalea alkaliphila]|uniref:PA2779 family protein n=1 Tax=Desulfatitalea alkaliphila TaxID=2929485 RepID=A0AA41UJD2_9BACT|nr:PA2779 family protein [Desulfatitalea alkaliphila]MCJ8499261.1 PA2779 family protein [Desulfatitalea alkaliphila]